MVEEVVDCEGSGQSRDEGHGRLQEFDHVLGEDGEDGVLPLQGVEEGQQRLDHVPQHHLGVRNEHNLALKQQRLHYPDDVAHRQHFEQAKHCPRLSNPLRTEYSEARFSTPTGKRTSLWFHTICTPTASPMNSHSPATLLAYPAASSYFRVNSLTTSPKLEAQPMYPWERELSGRSVWLWMDM